MTPQDILTELNRPTVQSERLLDACRQPDLTLWREHPELYVAFVERLIEQGHFSRALELAREGEKHFQHDSQLQYQLALAAARGGNAKYAEELLAPILQQAIGPAAARPADMQTQLLVEIIALQGRILKDHLYVDLSGYFKFNELCFWSGRRAWPEAAGWSSQGP